MSSAWKRWLRRTQLRTWRAVRGHYMLGVTAVILALAAAGGSGALGSTDAPRGRPAARPIPPQEQSLLAISYPNQTIGGPVAPVLVVTYYIVATEEERNTLNALKDQLINREWLRKNAFEVMLVRTPEEEPGVLAFIEERRQLTSAAQFIVEDLRIP